MRYDVVPIKEPVEGFLSALKPMFEGTNRDVTEENLQSRTRGVILMAISNKFGCDGADDRQQVGNVGRLCDALWRHERRLQSDQGCLQDAKSYRLADWRNTQGFVIPERIITKAPTAELRENQKDQDTLPPYDVLDDILEGPGREELPVAEIVAAGYDEALVKRIQHMLYVAEYKRRQAAPGVKITRRNFGRDRRYPITNGFRDGR